MSRAAAALLAAAAMMAAPVRAMPAGTAQQADARPSAAMTAGGRQPVTPPPAPLPAPRLPAEPASDTPQVAFGATGFSFVHRLPSTASPQRLLAAVGEVGQWWQDSHSWSGRAANMTIALRAGGCWCEEWPAGSVEHMRVIHYRPGRQLLLRGMLGPLAMESGMGVLDLSVEPAGTGSQLVWRYRVGGLGDGRASPLAVAVGTVLKVQMTRLVAYAEGRSVTKR